MDRETALSVVVSCLRETLEQSGGTVPEVNEETVIVGQAAVLDSIAVVSLIVDIEQKLEMEHDVSVTLASEKAMSMRSSPFRTAGVLADHVIATMQEGQSA
jgi:acyl carrier protein